MTAFTGLHCRKHYSEVFVLMADRKDFFFIFNAQLLEVMLAGILMERISWQIKRFEFFIKENAEFM